MSTIPGLERPAPVPNDLTKPFWDACNDTGLPVNFHIGASETSFNMFGRAAWPSTVARMSASERF